MIFIGLRFAGETTYYFTRSKQAGETTYSFARSKVQARLHVFARPKVQPRLHILARPKVQARLQFLKICKRYQALYKQHHYSPSTIITSESLAIETVSNTSQISACLYRPEILRRSHSNQKAGALKQPKLLYLLKCIFNSFRSTKLLYGPRRTYIVPVVSYLCSTYISTDLISKYLQFIYKVIL